jgi:hypothetical protein
MAIRGRISICNYHCSVGVNGEKSAKEGADSIVIIITVRKTGTVDFDYLPSVVIGEFLGKIWV